VLAELTHFTFKKREINLNIVLIEAKIAALKGICFIHPRDVVFLIEYRLFCAETTIS